MKICVFGAGAIGGYLAAHLGTVAGVQLSVVARGAHLQAIQREGLRLLTPAGERRVRVAASDAARELGPQDLVIIALKSHQVTGALPEIAHLLGPDTAVMPPTTGIPYWYFHGLSGPLANHRLASLDPGGRQWAVLDPERVLGCVYWVATEVTGPGLIHHDGSLSRFPMGEPDGSNSPRIGRVAEVFQVAGLEAPVVPDIRAWIWAKMISSLCWNPIAVLTGGTLCDMNARPHVVGIVRRMMAEADALALRLGVTRMPLSIDDRIAAACRAGDHKMSMLQDVERGRPLEIGVLLDSVQAMKALAGMDTPVLDDVYALLQLKVHKLGLGGAFRPVGKAIR
jgi:2-dehydropantoate 2-reductase